MEDLNKIQDIDIEFIELGYKLKGKTQSLKNDMTRSTKEYITYWEDWAISFTREHEPGYKPRLKIKPSKRGSKLEDID